MKRSGRGPGRQLPASQLPGQGHGGLVSRLADIRSRRLPREAELPQRRAGGERGMLFESAHRELAVTGDRAGVGREDAVEDLQERGFARPVLPDESDPLPVVDAEGHRLEQGGIQEGLAHAVERQNVHA